MSISPETVESQMDRERSIRRNMQFPQAVVVGVQSNRLCTLTVLVEELLLHERRFNGAVVKTAALFIVLQLEP